jgi:hypothetical protein
MLKESENIPVFKGHAIKTYGREGGTGGCLALHILDSAAIFSTPIHLSPGKESPVSTG